ncbi:hypothetical protein [Massilia sp. PWRC2]|uniref:hypothetical protein n=1 Tax=Massilia sp. PWRC2 TaxID=2804626 RepID=UPI003CFB7733
MLADLERAVMAGRLMDMHVRSFQVDEDAAHFGATLYVRLKQKNSSVMGCAL